MGGYNLAIIGKSGVGKSSLLNYLFDKEVAKTGSGKPVTRQGFHFYTSSVNQREVNVYDSWGIEAGKTDIWIRDFEKFLDERKSLNIKDWIHTVVYCLSAEGKRIENYEKEILRKLLAEHLNPIIAITKSDLDKDKEFYNAVLKEFPSSQIVQICSVTSIVGLGSNKKTSEKLGCNNLSDAIILNGAKSFKRRFIEIRNHFLKIRRNNAIKNLMPRIEIIIDSYSTSSIFDGNINEKNVEIILERVQNIVYNYDDDTSTELQKLIKTANNFYQQSFLFINEEKYVKNFDLGVLDRKKIITSDIFDDGDSFLGSFINGLTLNLLSIGISYFSQNRISKEKLYHAIKEKVYKHYNF